MKSENKWSEDQVEELLTTFFRDEIPSRLQGPMPVLAALPPQSAAAQTHSSRSWSRAALVGCAAALLLTMGVALRTTAPVAGESTGPAVTENDGIVEDRVNVNSGEVDDFHVPEQEIELMDDPQLDQ